MNLLKKRVFLFGCGRLGELLYFACKEYANIQGFIDNNLEKQGGEFNGIRIFSLKEVLKQEDFFIIISTNQHYIEIEAQLNNAGLDKHADYCNYKEWFKNIYLRHNVVLQGYVELYITDKCTMRCEACGLFIPYLKKHVDCDIDTLIKTVDLYFAVVDKVIEFRILGGEPFLFRMIDKLIENICVSYSSRIGRMKIVSNGTVIPKSSTLLMMKKFCVEVDISDYPNELAIKQRNKLVSVMNEYNVSYRLMQMKQWIKIYDNPLESKGLSKAQVINLFHLCNQGCRALYNNRLYYCSIDCAAQRAGLIEGDSFDCLDLLRCKHARRNIIDFDLYGPSKGYVSFCCNCNGGLGINRNYIDVARQLVD